MSAVDELDATVRHIRTVIFGLQRPLEDAPASLRGRTLDMCAAAGRVLGFEPRVIFDGPIDTIVSASVGDEMLAVLRESLSNVSRHASARTVSVDVTVDTSRLAVVITDDGVGINGPGHSGGDGLENMRTRAAKLDGTFSLGPGPDGDGARVTWSVPLGGAC
jgi:signal transduction histidine kinase